MPEYPIPMFSISSYLKPQPFHSLIHRPSRQTIPFEMFNAIFMSDSLAQGIVNTLVHGRSPIADRQPPF